MSYYLTQSDRDTLKTTINTVNNLVSPKQGNKRPTIKNAFAYVKLTEEDANGLWSAVEVYFDETGTSAVLADGRTWGGDEPSIIVNGDISADQVIRIEAHYLVDSSDLEQAVWVGSAIGGGGGTTIQRLQAKADVTLTPNVLDTLNFRTVTFGNDEITPSVDVIQNKVSQAFYEENEIIYGEFDSVGNRYILDPFIFAQGIQNATI